jgi:lycopene beta-cyclase
MVKGRNYGLLIAGGGLAGSLAALAMARLRPEVPLLLASEGGALGGRGTYFVFEEALGDGERTLLTPLVSQSWEGCYALLPGRARKLRLRCHAIEATAIDAAVRAALRPEQLRLDARIVAVRDDSLLLAGGETVAGIGALDARGWAHQTTLELGWRHGVDRTVRLPVPHRLDLPVAADTSLGNANGCALFTCLPLDAQRLVVEHVRYARGAEPDAAGAGAAIDAWLAARGWAGAQTEAEEAFASPVPLGGDFGGYWRIGGARVAKLGARGGFFGTGFGSNLADAAATALSLSRRRDYSGAALHDVFEAEAASLWRAHEFHRAFLRPMIETGGCGAIEALYGSDTVTVGRFFAGRLGLLDRRRLLAAASG